MSIIQIQIRGISAFGYHGVFEHEKLNGQNFYVDLEISYDASAAIATDDLNNAIDYGEIVKYVKSIIEGDSKDLIEVVADLIADKILEFEKVIRVQVILHKPQAPVEVSVGDIAVKIEKSK